MMLPQGVYEEYVQRGESENRNRELKVDLCAGRLSDHRFMANLFRLLMHSAALNLMIRLRRSLPDAEPDATAASQQPAFVAVAGLLELRRAQPATWRIRIIKVAAEIVVNCRRVLIRLSSAWPNLPTWRAVLLPVQRL